MFFSTRSRSNSPAAFSRPRSPESRDFGIPDKKSVICFSRPAHPPGKEIADICLIASALMLCHPLPAGHS